MGRTEIMVTSGEPDYQVFEMAILEGEDAITQGYKRFKEIIEHQADFLVRASVYRDFDDVMTVNIFLKGYNTEPPARD